MGADEEGTLAATKAIRRKLVDPKTTEHRGRIVKTTGDGLLVEFASVVDAVRGPRIFPSGSALSQTGGHGDVRPRTQPVETCACCAGGAALSRIADGVAECRRAARDELRKGATHIKILASGGVAPPYDPIWNLQYSEEEVRAIVEEAQAWRTYVMAHAYSPEAIRRSIDFGVRSIEHGNLIDRATAEHVAAPTRLSCRRSSLMTHCTGLVGSWAFPRSAWPSSPRSAKRGWRRSRSCKAPGSR